MKSLLMVSFQLLVQLALADPKSTLIFPFFNDQKLNWTVDLVIDPQATQEKQGLMKVQNYLKLASPAATKSLGNDSLICTNTRSVLPPRNITANYGSFTNGDCTAVLGKACVDSVLKYLNTTDNTQVCPQSLFPPGACSDTLAVALQNPFGTEATPKPVSLPINETVNGTNAISTGGTMFAPYEQQSYTHKVEAALHVMGVVLNQSPAKSRVSPVLVCQVINKTAIDEKDIKSGAADVARPAMVWIGAFMLVQYLFMRT